MSIASSCKDANAKREDFADSFRPSKCPVAAVELEELQLVCDDASTEDVVSIFAKLESKCDEIKKLGFTSVEIIGADSKKWSHRIKADGTCAPGE